MLSAVFSAAVWSCSAPFISCRQCGGGYGTAKHRGEDARSSEPVQLHLLKAMVYAEDGSAVEKAYQLAQNHPDVKW